MPAFVLQAVLRRFLKDSVVVSTVIAAIVAIVNNFTDTHPAGNLHFLHLFVDHKEFLLK